MNRTAIVVAVLLGMVSTAAGAQMRRSGGADGRAPAGEMPKGTPRDARHPYAGVWDGTSTLRGGPGGEHEIPIVMVLNVADASKGEHGDYAGATIMPNGARAPHLETQVVNGQMRWKQENSGGGYWAYAGKLAGPDSIAGTVALVDWPQLPAGEKPPAGTFTVVRRAPGR